MKMIRRRRQATRKLVVAPTAPTAPISHVEVIRPPYDWATESTQGETNVPVRSR